MKIAITGATGQLGRIAVEKLKERTKAENLVALVRSPEKASDLGIEVRTFDYAKPDALSEALRGIDTLFLISGNEIGQREFQHKNVIRAAAEAGVKRVVYSSLLRADESDISLAAEHEATEKALKASGLAYTILRNGWYTENYAASVGAALKNGALVGSAGDGKISSASREDYAEAAAVVLTSEGHQDKTYELAGDDAYTLTEFAAEISRQSGREIPYKNLPKREYAAILAQAGFPEQVAESFAGWDVNAADGDLFDDSKTLSKIIGRPTTSYAEVIKRFL